MHLSNKAIYVSMLPLVGFIPIDMFSFMRPFFQHWTLKPTLGSIQPFYSLLQPSMPISKLGVTTPITMPIPTLVSYSYVNNSPCSHPILIPSSIGI